MPDARSTSTRRHSPPVRRSLRLVVLGNSESGKSFWTKRFIDLLPAAHPVLIWDPTMEWAGSAADAPIANAQTFAGVRELCAAIAGGLVVRRAVIQSARADFAAFCQLCFDAGDLTCVIDEAHIHCKQGLCPDVFLTLMRVSRHRRVNLVLIAQRPHGLAVDLRTQANTFMLFTLRASSSIEWIRNDLDPNLAAMVERLKPREYIKWPGFETNAVSRSV